MGILKGIFKSRNVNERSAMQMTAVYSCVCILSEAVVSLPLHVYKYNADGGKEKAVKHPLYFLLHAEPNPEMTSFVFRETLMTHLLATAQNTMHDRYIILDYGKRSEKIYHCGASSKDAGKRTTTIIEVQDRTVYRQLVDILIKNPILVLA